MANMNNRGLLRLTDTRMIFRNFSGKKSDFNAEGDRNFGAVVDEEMAEQLMAEGIKVKTLRPQPGVPDATPTNWIKVKVNFATRQPPKVYLIKADPEDPENQSKMIRVRLDEDTINQLDWIYQSTILHIDMNIRFSRYPDRPGRPGGISNYLDALYVTVEDDPLDRKYRNIRGVEEEDNGPDEELPFD